MGYFLSKKTITNCFNELNNFEYSNGNRKCLFLLLILKHAGFNELSYIDLDSPKIKDKLFEATNKFAAIAPGPNNTKDIEYNFINPLMMMSGWTNQNPKEPLSKWSKTRLKNNIVGGGQQWNQIYNVDDENDSNIIEKKSGIPKLIKENEKFPVELLAIWLNRFTNFSKEVSKSQLINDFYDYFHINNEERDLLFTNDLPLNIDFSSEPISPNKIRELIGNPKQQTNWIESHIQEDQEYVQTIQTAKSKNIYDISSTNITAEKVERLLDKEKQLILMGPPGTSKSYIAEQISKKYSSENVLHIQFHPQYTYQEFIGGQILENGTLKDKKGTFITFLDKALHNSNEKYLVIIDELNRANVSQVFGELIQLLDRSESIKLTFNGKNKEYSLPQNLKIIGTMNTTDRTVGRLDFALKRRFYQVYCGVNYSILMDNVQIEDNSFSISELLRRINKNLISVLNNKEMVIGHASFLKSSIIHDNKYIWKKEDFYDLFNFLIKPIIFDYCNNDTDLINSILSNLSQDCSEDQFYESLQEFLL